MQEAWIDFIFSMWMRYGKKKNPVIFGGDQRSSGVTGGQISKTL